MHQIDRFRTKSLLLQSCKDHERASFECMRACYDAARNTPRRARQRCGGPECAAGRDAYANAPWDHPKIYLASRRRNFSCLPSVSRPHRLARSGHVPFTDVTGVRIPVGTPILKATQVATLEGDGAKNGSSPSSCVRSSEYFIYSLPPVTVPAVSRKRSVGAGANEGAPPTDKARHQSEFGLGQIR